MTFQFIVIVAAICSANLGHVNGSPAYAVASARPKPDVPINLPVFAPYSAPVVPFPSNFAKFTAPGEGNQQFVPCIAPCIPFPEYVARVVPVAPPVGSNKVLPKIAPVYGPPETQRARVTEEPKEEKPKQDNSYQYSYVVYDEDTGDQKAQHESSDGSKVEGQYSLIQPDGYIREVQYTADDLSGFNAVVKNFLPKSPIPGAAVKSNVQESKKPKPVVKSSEWDIQSIEAPKETKEQPKFKEDIKKFEETGPVPTIESPKKTNKESKKVTDDSKKIFLSYEDIIRCANLVANGKFVTAPNNENPKSPLTYIILPTLGYGKPC